MIITTTPNIEGKAIYEYLGIVTVVAECVYVGDTTYKNALIDARETALREMEQQAAQRGANAVVGADIDYKVLGTSNGALMVTGTAVKIRFWKRR